MKKLTALLGTTLVLSTQIASPAFAQESATPDKPLTGAEVLDYDGQILRNALKAQAGVNRPATPVTASVPVAVAPMRVVPVRRKDITLDVYGIDARAVGGPVENSARIRYDNRYYKVSVRSQVGELRVLRITDAGTTLAGLNGKRTYTVFLPHEDEARADAPPPAPALTQSVPRAINPPAVADVAEHAISPVAGAAARPVQGTPQPQTTAAKPPMLAPAATAPLPPGLIPPAAASQPQAGAKQAAMPPHLSPPALAVATH